MNRESVWITRDGQRMKIKDMQTNHIVNSARLILLKGSRLEYFKAFMKELQRRGEDFEYDGYRYDGDYISIRNPAPVKTAKPIKKEWNIIQRPKSVEAN